MNKNNEFIVEMTRKLIELYESNIALQAKLSRAHRTTRQLRAALKSERKTRAATKYARDVRKVEEQTFELDRH